MTKFSINKTLIKPLVWISKFFDDSKLLIVCKGYDEDDVLFTGLYWQDDKDIDLSDNSYFDFQLWIKP